MRGRIVEIHKEGVNPIGLVEFDGRRRAVYLTLIPTAKAGDDILFHAGFATELLPPSEPPSPPNSGLPRGLSATPEINLDNGGAYRVLSGLEPAQLRKILPLAEEKQYAAGDIIFPAGATALFLHLIVSGDVALCAVTGQDTDEVQTLHAGDCMGWSALSGSALTHFQARALSPVATIAIHGEQLRATCDSDPALGYALLKQLVELASERLDAMRLKLAQHHSPALAAG